MAHYNHIITVMDSTMIYDLISEQATKEGELLNLLPTLARLVAPLSPLSIYRMNDHQILAQIYAHVRNHL